MASLHSTSAPVHLPRIAISYCTQCRWMLRAAYFGQELLSTFGTQIGEIALIPCTGGLFEVELMYCVDGEGRGGEGEGEVESKGTSKGEDKIQVKKVLIWDRKAEGGFPETKVLKQRLRDHIDPSRDLGHSDKGGKAKAAVDEAGVVVGKKKEELGKGGVEVAEKKQAEVGKMGGAAVKRNPDGSVCEDCQ
ncbi:hypothetical protein IAQ61_009524 [Plenodomus lingam]|uniref:uncharacterized protein n=1 Tax=Leptosphaeria maculans TaxID=5022 RepID=UPI00331C300E|nr:hypothetical protein IAQ61_009524 [Plenodomus lingam]